MYSESGNLMEMLSLEVCMHSIVGCMASKLVLVVGGKGQVKARGYCSLAVGRGHSWRLSRPPVKHHCKGIGKGKA